MSPRFARFGEFELDFAGFVLRRRGSATKLESLPLNLLMLLVRRKGELVTRVEIEKALWGDGVFVDVEQGINTAIGKIRLALRDHPERPRFLQTVVGRGYRFLATEVVEAETSLAENAYPVVTLEELGQAVRAAAGLSASDTSSSAPMPSSNTTPGNDD